MHPSIIHSEQPLTQQEETLFAELEAVIEANMKGFVLVGMALAKIRDQRLYRIQYPTFEDYLLRVWDMARARAYQLMEAADVHGNLKGFLENVNHGGQISLSENVNNCRQTDVNNCSQNDNVNRGTQTIEDILPQNEAQARPLTSFPPERQREIWLQVLDRASTDETRVTANLVIQVILDLERKELKERVKKHAERTDKEAILPPLVKTTYLALLQVVQNQNDEEWKGVGKPTMIGLLEDLLADLKR